MNSKHHHLATLQKREWTTSTLHFPEGYYLERHQYKCYPAERVARHQHILEVLSSHVPTITLEILALALLQWHNRCPVYRLSDILAYASCLVLHDLSHPLLSLCLAVFYTTWVSLPGSFASLILLSYARFLATTNFTPSPHADEETCMVCWEEDTFLGHLACKHLACSSCLIAMALVYQTFCPFCKHLSSPSTTTDFSSSTKPFYPSNQSPPSSTSGMKSNICATSTLLSWLP